MHRRMLATALAVAALFTGCSGSGSDDGAAVSTTVASTDTTALAATEALFTDPQGAYQLTVPSTWEESHGVVVAEIELWLVEEPKDNFAPNVNILTQQAPGVTLSDYLEASLANAPAVSPDFELLSSELVEGSNGQELATMEYRAGEQRYLGVFGMTADGQAIVATLTAPIDRYDTIHDAVLPYLLTLEPLPAG